MSINTLKDYFFWFAQPQTVLNNYDWLFAYIFAALILLGIILWLAKKLFVRHIVIQKLLQKFVNVGIWMGLVGLIWLGFRYESVPIFAKRIFAGSILLVALVWIGFVKWYFFRHFFKEKKEYDYDQVKNKYMPKTR